MDSLIRTAARTLEAGDPLGALNWVALRGDAPALALVVYAVIWAVKTIVQPEIPPLDALNGWVPDLFALIAAFSSGVTR
jgi:hypothetical protein